jgi:hypothetical protein
MAVSGTAAYIEEQIGGQPRRLILRNGEIERFEAQHGLGIFGMFDQLFGRGPAPQARHVRDLLALGLIGGGMRDATADELIASQPPSENLRFREIAQRLLGVTFMPSVLDATGKKPRAGSRAAGRVQPPATTAPETGSGT